MNCSHVPPGIKTAGAILIALSAAAGAQPADPVDLKVGDPIFDGGSVQPITKQWKISQSYQSRTLDNWGSSTYKVELVDVDGRPTVKRTQVIVTPHRTVTYTFVSDRKTLAAISAEESDDKGQYQRFDLEPDRVKVKRRVPGSPEGKFAQSEIKLEMPVLDVFGGVNDLLLARVPLKEGYAFRLPVLVTAKGTTGWQAFKVTGKQAVDSGQGKQAAAWVVETSVDDFRVVFWILDEPPHLIKVMNHGPRGGVQTFDIQ